METFYTSILEEKRKDLENRINIELNKTKNDRCNPQIDKTAYRVSVIVDKLLNKFNETDIVELLINEKYVESVSKHKSFTVEMIIFGMESAQHGYLSAQDKFTRDVKETPQTDSVIEQSINIENIIFDSYSYYLIKSKNASSSLNSMDSMILKHAKSEIAHQTTKKLYEFENLETNINNRKLLTALAAEGVIKLINSVPNQQLFTDKYHNKYGKPIYGPQITPTLDFEKMVKDDKPNEHDENLGPYGLSDMDTIDPFSETGELLKNFYEPNKSTSGPIFNGNTKLIGAATSVSAIIMGAAFMLYSYFGQERLMNKLVMRTFPSICEKFHDSEKHNRKIIDSVKSQWFEKYSSTLKATQDNPKVKKIANMCYHTLRPRGNGYNPEWQRAGDLRLMFMAGNAANRYNQRIHRKILDDPSVKTYVKEKISLERKIIEQNRRTDSEANSLSNLQMVSQRYNNGIRLRFFWESRY